MADRNKFDENTHGNVDTLIRAMVHRTSANATFGTATTVLNALYAVVHARYIDISRPIISRTYGSLQWDEDWCTKGLSKR